MIAVQGKIDFLAHPLPKLINKGFFRGKSGKRKGKGLFLELVLRDHIRSLDWWRQDQKGFQFGFILILQRRGFFLAVNNNESIRHT